MDSEALTAGVDDPVGGELIDPSRRAGIITDDQSSRRKYGHILSRVYSTAWAIQGRRLADILDVLRFQSAGGKLSADEIREYVGVQAAAPREQSAGAIQVLGLRGIISHRIEMMNDISGPGGTSVEQFSQRFRQAVANPNVGAIVIDVDSPGGAVDGVPELAEQIRSARGTKPIIAHANTLAASAAYWLASQADEVVVTPSGEVGSIGVFAAHRDISEQLAMDGERVTLIHAGKYKVEGNPYEPLSDEARGEIQRKVDGAYIDFLEAVAAGRNVSTKKARTDFGEGRTLSARDALAAGMVDRVETFDATINRLQGATEARRRRAHAERERRIAFA